MGITDIFKKKEEPKAAQAISSRRQHVELVTSRAKHLINELVSPLTKPDQQLINELLDLITNTASMPPGLINKEAVLNNAKQLLIKLIEPIPEPNHQLVNELIQLIGFTVMQEDPKQAAALQQIKQQAIDKTLQQAIQAAKPEAAKQETKQEIKQDPKVFQKGGSVASLNDEDKAREERILQKLSEDKSVMNLILEQIRELIQITNNLNDKFKKTESRVDGNEQIMNKLKEKVDSMDGRMSGIEKNIEKFIGLYEVVTNQYNPFVENIDEVIPKKEVKVVEIRKPTAFTTKEGKQVTTLHDLLDEIINMSNDAFSGHISQGKNDFADWVQDVLKQQDLAEELKKLTVKSDIVKAIMKRI